MKDRVILLVDDEVHILDLLEELFSDAGYTVFRSESAEGALKILQERSVPVMILDLRLPGMSGLDLCRRIRERNRTSILYAITGYSNLFGIAECRSAGFDEIFFKPVDLNILLKAVKEAFDRLDRQDMNKQ